MLSLLTAVALAADPILLPPPPLHDDASAILQVIDASGKVKVKAEAGKILETTPIEGGVAVRWLPPQVDAPTEVTFHLRARGAHADTLAKVTVIPGFQRAIDVTADAATLDPGATTTLRFATPSRPWVTASAGTVGPITEDGAGFQATYTPPAVTAPTRVIITAADPRAPTERFGHISLGLRADAALTLPAEADSTNTLEIGGSSYGPVTASPSGTAAFAVRVDPDHPAGLLTSKRRDGKVVLTTVPLPAAKPSIGFIPLPKQIPAETPLTAIAVCVTASGADCAANAMSAKLSKGKAGKLASMAGGVAVPFTAPEGAVALTVETTGVNATINARAVEAPAVVSLSAVPGRKNDFTIDARLKTAAGTPDTQHTPLLDVSGGSVTSKPRDKRDGSYTATIALDKAAAFARVTASTGGAVTGLEPRRVVAWTTQTAIAADGTSTALLVVAVEDALGAPIPDANVALSTLLGDASVAPTAKTGKDGVARIKLRAGTAPGPVTVAASVDGLAATTTIWQDSGGKPPELLPIGSEDDLPAVARWQARVPTLFVSRGQRPVTPPAGPPPTMAAPTITRRDGASGTAAPTVVAKAPRTPGDTPWFRFRATAIDAPHHVTATTSGDAGTQVGPEATWTTSPLLGEVGAQADAELWFAHQKAAFDVRARGTAFRIQFADDAPVQLPLDVEAGLRFAVARAGRVSFVPEVGAVYARNTAIVYADAGRARVTVDTFPTVGGKVGFGVRYQNGGMLVAFNLASVWTPVPMLARGELVVDIPLSKPVALSAAIAGDARWTTLSGTDGALHQRRVGGEVRIGVSFAAF